MQCASDYDVSGDHDVAARLNNLAMLYYQQGKYAEARQLYQRAPSIAEAAQGPNHPDTELYKNNLKVCQDAMR